MGAVYEPYLRFTPDISLFVSGLLSGLTFAESAYQSQIALSWMVTFVGDPLYRPFPRNFYENLDAAQTSKSSNLPWLRLRKARLLANAGSISETRAAVNQLLEEFPKNKIILEGSADIYRDLNEKKDATQLYEEDLDLLDEKDSNDRFRILMKLAEIFRRDDKTKSAIDTYEKIAQEFPEATKGTGLGDRALSFASGEGISELPPALLAYKNAVEAEQLAAAVAKAAAQPPANLKPEATAADQAAVLKAAGPRPSLKDSSTPALPPQPAGTKTNSPSVP
jgi:tetratricopeptide (TPR) repeat protein